MPTQHTFPKNFLWGAATSSHQVEGDNFYNDWWDWEQKGLLKEYSGKACDHWNRYEEDFSIAQSLHHNAHRFSIEWSRIEPKEGEFNEEALAHYAKVIKSLKAHHLEPIVTLHHFTLPLWFAKQGGWYSKDAPEKFARYVKKAVESIGEGVTYWMTINEPEVYVFKSYWLGDWPPGEKSYDKSYKVFTHLLKGHVLAYSAIHEVTKLLNRKPVMVGLAKHVSACTPCDADSWKDRVTSWVRNLSFNHLFIKALIHGRIFYPGLFHIKLPRMKTLDFLGLNYYTRDFVRSFKKLSSPEIFGDICGVDHHPIKGKCNSLQWEIYPEGIYKLVKDFSMYKLPILISENGICTDDDRERVEFIRDHLSALSRAIKEGVSVIGYLYWSLMDNFEWAEGFAPHFGIVEVDYKTQKRTIRPSGHYYAKICETGQL